MVYKCPGVLLKHTIYPMFFLFADFHDPSELEPVHHFTFKIIRNGGSQHEASMRQAPLAILYANYHALLPPKKQSVGAPSAGPYKVKSHLPVSGGLQH